MNGKAIMNLAQPLCALLFVSVHFFACLCVSFHFSANSIFPDIFQFCCSFSVSSFEQFDFIGSPSFSYSTEKAFCIPLQNIFVPCGLPPTVFTLKNCINNIFFFAKIQFFLHSEFTILPVPIQHISHQFVLKIKEKQVVTFLLFHLCETSHDVSF